jgi:hypothetical protein
MNNCSNGSNVVGLVTCVNSFIVSVGVSYSLLILRIWSDRMIVGHCVLCIEYVLCTVLVRGVLHPVLTF